MTDDEWQASVEKRLADDALHRHSIRVQIDAVVRKADMQSEQIDSIRGGLEENTKATKDIQKNTSEMLDIFQSWKGAMKVLEVLGKAAKPAAAIIAFFAALAAWWINLRGIFK